MGSALISLARASSQGHNWLQVKLDNVVVYARWPCAQLKSRVPATGSPTIGKCLYLGAENFSLSLISVTYLLCELR